MANMASRESPPLSSWARSMLTTESTPMTERLGSQFLVTKSQKVAQLRVQFDRFAAGVSELKQEMAPHDPECAQEFERLSADVLKLFCSAAVGKASSPSEDSECNKQKPPISVKPKTFPKAKMEADSSSSASEGSPSESKYSKPDRGKTDGSSRWNKRGKDKCVNSGGGATMDTLVQALSRLDVRRAPRPGKFEMTSGRPFGFFLKEFEEYCENSFRGCSSSWSSELESFLSGTILKAYQALHIPGEPYDNIKSKLMDWCQEHRSTVSDKIRKLFEKSKINPGESLRLYAARLERDFIIAYPSKGVQMSQAFQKRFMETVPKSFQKHVFSVKSFLKMQGLKLELASAYDAENGGVDSTVELESEHPEVWVSASPASFVSNRSSNTETTGKGQSESKRQTQVFDSRTCHFCGRKGHVKSTCWRFNNKCLACGSDEHKVSTCPTRSPNRTSQTPKKVIFEGSNCNCGHTCPGNNSGNC